MTDEFFTGNRANLRKQLAPGSALIMTAFGDMQRGIDSAHMFEQEANFWYLTGVNAPDWQLIMDVDTGDEWLVAPTINDMQAIFDGSLALADATLQSGVKTVIDQQQAKSLLVKLLAEKQQIYSIAPLKTEAYGFYANPALPKMWRKLKSAKKLTDVRLTLAKQRAIKQPAEVNAIQHAINITVDGILAVLPHLADYQHEYQAEAAFTYEFRRRGATGHAYDPIVAAGKNACTLHYVANNSPLKPDHSPLKPDQWLLFDVGARAGGYCADITRTVPLGQPTEFQLAAYQAVKKVHDAAVALCRPGQSIRDYVLQTEALMGDELVKLKLINKPTTQNIRKYFPHAISHGLGVDVHDALGRPDVFAQGMVLTVEPGIYVPEQNLGIRLEDDILVTANGPKNLSAKLPSNVNELRNLI